MVRIFIVLATLGVASSPAFAQSRGSRSSGESAPKELSPDEMRSEVRSLVSQIKAQRDAVTKAVEQATAKNDVDLVACLSKPKFKLATLKDTADTQAGEILSILSVPDPEMAQARLKFRLLGFTAGTATKASEEANQCSSTGGATARAGTSSWSGGVGADDDTVDDNALSDVDIQMDPPVVSQAEP